MKTIEKQVQTILHTSDDGEYTYSVTKLLDGEKKKHMVLVSLYPTRTEKNLLVDDDTTKHLMAHLPELGFDSVSIVNLFSKVVKNCRMSTRGLEVDRMNLDYIRDTYIQNEAFSDSTWVIAWGSSGSTSKGIRQAKEELMGLWKKRFPKKKIFQLAVPGAEAGSGSALHPLYLGIRAGRAKWKLTEFDWKSCMPEK